MARDQGERDHPDDRTKPRISREDADVDGRKCERCERCDRGDARERDDGEPRRCRYRAGPRHRRGKRAQRRRYPLAPAKGKENGVQVTEESTRARERPNRWLSGNQPGDGHRRDPFGDIAGEGQRSGVAARDPKHVGGPRIARAARTRIGPSERATYDDGACQRAQQIASDDKTGTDSDVGEHYANRGDCGDA